MPARALGLVLVILFLVTPAGAQTQRPDPAAALAGLDAVIEQGHRPHRAAEVTLKSLRSSPKTTES